MITISGTAKFCSSHRISHRKWSQQIFLINHIAETSEGSISQLDDPSSLLRTPLGNIISDYSVDNE